MQLPPHLGAPKRLGEFVAHLDEPPISGWLYIREATKTIDFALECFPVLIDSRDVSEDEMREFEAAADAAGFRSFLGVDQLRDIVNNLGLQRADYTVADLERAIDFYWQNDAFVVLSDNSA